MEQSSGGTTFSYVRRSLGLKSCKRRRKTKVEAFGKLGILPSAGRKHQCSGGVASTVG
jgi:hypothetical protein